MKLEENAIFSDDYVQIGDIFKINDRDILKPYSKKLKQPDQVHSLTIKTMNFVKDKTIQIRFNDNKMEPALKLANFKDLVFLGKIERTSAAVIFQKGLYNFLSQINFPTRNINANSIFTLFLSNRIEKLDLDNRDF